MKIEILKQRLFSKLQKLVDKTGGINSCWPYMAGRNRDGYGRCGRGKFELAHRVSYMFTFGEIPEGLKVLHRCDNPPCCNPSHLFLGTILDNNRDMMEKGRTAKGDKNGARTHPECRPSGARHGRHTHPECSARGERVGTSKLIKEQVIEIRKKYASGFYSYEQLAAEYNCDYTNIGCIVQRKTWRHVP